MKKMEKSKNSFRIKSAQGRAPKSAINSNKRKIIIMSKIQIMRQRRIIILIIIIMKLLKQIQININSD